MRSILTAWAQWADACGWLEELALKSTILMVSALALTALLKRRHILACAAVWNAALLGLLVLPVAVAVGPRFAVWTPTARATATRPNTHYEDVPRADYSVAPAPSVIVDSDTAAAAPASMSVDAHARQSSPPPGPPSIPIRGVLILVLALGILIAALRLPFAIAAVRRLQRDAIAVADPVWRDAVTRWCDDLGIHRPVSICSTPHVDVPLVVGALRPTILLPVRLAGRPDEHDVDAVVAHELAHVRRGDYAWQLLLRLVQAIYWYHPVVWAAGSSIAASRERACDEFAVYAVGSADRYAETLLKMAESLVRRPATSLGMTVVRKPRIAGRLDALRSSAGNRACRLTKRATLLFLSLGLTITCALAGAVAGDDATPQTQSDTDGSSTTSSHSDEEVAVDLYGDPLPDGAVLRLGTARLRQGRGRRHSVAFSPTGDVLASTDGNHINLWNTATGRRIRWFGIEEGWVNEVAFSPRNDEVAASCSDGMIRVWDLSTGEVSSIRFYDMLKPYARTSGFAWSPDGTKLALGWESSGTGLGQRVLVFDRATGELLQALHDGLNKMAIAWSPDGTYIAHTTFNPPARLWNAETGELVRDFQLGVEAFAISIDISPDGKTVAAGCIEGGRAEIMVCLWELETGELKASWPSDDAVSVNFTPDGRTLVCATEHGLIEVFDVGTGLRRVIETGLGIARTGALTPDGKTVAVGAAHSEIGLWDVETGRNKFAEFEGPSSEIRSVSYSPDGRLIATMARDGEVGLWDAGSSRLLRKFNSSDSACLAFEPSGERLATAGHSDGEVHIWDVQTGERLQVLDSGEGWLQQLAYSADGGLLVTVGRAKNPRPRPFTERVHVWDATTGEHLRKFEITTPTTMSLVLLPGRLSVVLASGYNEEAKAIEVRDLETGEQIAVLAGPQSVNCIDYTVSLDNLHGLLASGGWDKTIRLWDPRTWETVAVLEGHNDEIRSVAFSPDGEWLASCDDGGSIRLWDVSTRTQVREFRGHNSSCLSLAFSPDGRRLVTGMKDGTAVVWKVHPDAD